MARSKKAKQCKNNAVKPRISRDTRRVCDDYCRSLCDPVKYGAGSTIPVIGPPSFPYTVRTRSAVTVGTNGVGFAYCNPSMALANDLWGLRVTDATFTGTNLATAGVGLIEVPSDSIYTQASFGNTVETAQLRVVSASLRLVYIGTRLDCNGMVRSTALPSLSSVAGMTGAQFSNIKQAQGNPAVPGRYLTVTWAPEDPTSLSHYHKDATSAAYAANMCHYITADPGSKFYAEAVVNYELTGPLVAGLSRPRLVEDSAARRIAGWFSDQVAYVVSNPQEAAARMAHGIRVARDAANAASLYTTSPPWRVEL